MQEATDFADFWNYFFDYFGEQDWFSDASVRIHEKNLEERFAQCAGFVTGKTSIKVKRALLLEIPGQDFVHGTMHFDGKIACVTFFRDIDTGILSVATPGETMTRFLRFSPPKLERLKMATAVAM
ncbi:MAG: hypothetical protein HYZ37_09430 [Candidatus Solibacter usitatus]|nr:hypothetical protein [Candidatus Solibacter usitatus]